MTDEVRAATEIIGIVFVLVGTVLLFSSPWAFLPIGFLLIIFGNAGKAKNGDSP